MVALARVHWLARQSPARPVRRGSVRPDRGAQGYIYRGYWTTVVHWRRFIWDLHGVLGFWTFALILMWAVSGIYFAFPRAFYDVGEFVAAHGAGPDMLQRMDVLTDWLARLHFGRAFGPWVKVLWSALGVVPAALLVTGTLMWWNRVLRRTMGHSGEA